MQNKKYFSLLAIAVIMLGFMVAAPAFAQGPNGFGRGGRIQPGVFGTVASVSGNTITVTSKMKQQNGNTATYTVDASKAVVTKNGASSSVASIAVGDTISVQGTLSGTNITATNIRDGVVTSGVPGGMGINGTVASISGTTFTLTGRAKPNGGTAMTYTVDASSATVTKNGASSSVASIAVGDNIIVQGTVNGTSVIAKTIRDGMGQGLKNSVVQGNGQPIVAGKVTSISGTILTITNQSNVTYTIDASNAKIVKGNVLSSLSNVAVNDNIVVQGTVNGNSVTAYSVTDQTKPASSSGDGVKGSGMGFMGGIVNFFKHLFGF